MTYRITNAVICYPSEIIYSVPEKMFYYNEEYIRIIYNRHLKELKKEDPEADDVIDKCFDEINNTKHALIYHSFIHRRIRHDTGKLLNYSYALSLNEVFAKITKNKKFLDANLDNIFSKDDNSEFDHYMLIITDHECFAYWFYTLIYTICIFLLFPINLGLYTFLSNIRTYIIIFGLIVTLIWHSSYPADMRKIKKYDAHANFLY